MLIRSTRKLSVLFVEPQELNNIEKGATIRL